jgi:hypothetical protein
MHQFIDSTVHAINGDKKDWSVIVVKQWMSIIPAFQPYKSFVL